MNDAARIIKYVAIGFAIFLIVNIFFALWSLGGIVFGVLGTKGNTTFDETRFEEYSNALAIDINTTELEIKTSDALKVENNNKYIDIKQDNNKIYIKEKKSYIFGKTHNAKVIVYVPKELLFENVYIDAGAGKVTIDGLKTKVFDFDLGAGKATINNLIVTSKAIVDGGAGKVSILDSEINNLDLNAGVGEFNLKAKLNGNTDIAAGIGALNIDVLDCKENYTLNLEHGIGSITVDSKNAKNGITGSGPRQIKVDGGIGSIKINFEK